MDISVAKPQINVLNVCEWLEALERNKNGSPIPCYPANRQSSRKEIPMEEINFKRYNQECIMDGKILGKIVFQFQFFNTIVINPLAPIGHLGSIRFRTDLLFLIN